MIDFELALIWFDCPQCRVVTPPGGFCEGCNNAGEYPFYLGTLFANLAIAGGLCAAFEAGGRLGYARCASFPVDVTDRCWRPNVDGRMAEGMEES